MSYARLEKIHLRTHAHVVPLFKAQASFFSLVLLVVEFLTNVLNLLEGVSTSTYTLQPIKGEKPSSAIN